MSIKVLIDKYGRTACVDSNVYTIHWKDEYYLAIWPLSGIVDLVKLNESDSYVLRQKMGGEWVWGSDDGYEPERGFFLGLVTYDYSYVDNIGTLLTFHPDYGIDVSDEYIPKIREFLSEFMNAPNGK